MNIDESKLTCSFCGKHQREVKKLIGGPDVRICDNCIELAVDILNADRPRIEQLAVLEQDGCTDHPISLDMLDQILMHPGLRGTIKISLTVRHERPVPVSKLLAELHEIPGASFDDDQEIAPEVIRLVPYEVCVKHQLIPLELDDQTLVVAMADPDNSFAINDLKFLTGCNIRVVKAELGDIRDQIARYYKRRFEQDQEARNAQPFDAVLDNLETMFVQLAQNQPEAPKFDAARAVTTKAEILRHLHILVRDMYVPPEHCERVATQLKTWFDEVGNDLDGRLKQALNLAWNKFASLADDGPVVDIPISSIPLISRDQMINDPEALQAAAEGHKLKTTTVNITQASQGRYGTRAISRDMCVKYTVFPLHYWEAHGEIDLAVAHPDHRFAICDIEILTGCQVNPILVLRDQILAAIEMCYPATKPVDPDPEPHESADPFGVHERMEHPCLDLLEILGDSLQKFTTDHDDFEGRNFSWLSGAKAEVAVLLRALTEATPIPAEHRETVLTKLAEWREALPKQYSEIKALLSRSIKGLETQFHTNDS